MPQATLLGAGHDGQHAPLVHVEPAAHIVPVPHVRQTVTPSVAISEGIAMPHGTPLMSRPVSEPAGPL